MGIRGGKKVKRVEKRRQDRKYMVEERTNMNYKFTLPVVHKKSDL